MTSRVGFALLALVLAFGLASCGDAPKANDPAVAAGVLTQASTRCVAAGTTPTVTVTSDAADFTGSDFEGDLTASYSTFKMVFTNYSIDYDGKAYTIDGTVNFASNILSSSGSLSTGLTVSMTALTYSPGITISGPDFESTLQSDLKQDITSTTTINASGTTISLTTTLNGTIAGRSYVNKTISIFASY